MKNLVCAFVLSGLVSAGALEPSSGKPEIAARVLSIKEVLQAHNAEQNAALLSTWTAEAVKLTSYSGGVDGDSSSFFERKVEVVVSGDSFKRRKSDPLALREQVELVDGRSAYRAIRENGRQTENAELSDSQRVPVDFSIKTFGLVPILNQLSDPSVAVTYVGQTLQRQDKFNAATAVGNWTIYCDQQRSIRRVEFGDKIIEYADYRLVKGVRLPFIQRLHFRGRLVYELVFTRIELGPKLPPGYFNRENI